MLGQRCGVLERYWLLVFTDGVADCRPEVGGGVRGVVGDDEFAEENRGGDIQGVRGECAERQCE